MSKDFEGIMGRFVNIALATSVEDQPNVRIITCCREASHPAVLLFCTERTSPKAQEFAANEKVAFTTLTENVEHVRSKDAVVRKSPRTIADARELFLQIPGYASTLDALEEVMDLYEIHIGSAQVITGYDGGETVSFRG